MSSTRQRLGAAIGALVLLALIGLVASLPRSERVEGIFMARGIHSFRDVGMGALLPGRLADEGGCLAVASAPPGTAPYVVIWAREFSLRRDGGPLRLFESDRPVVAVGELVEVGGGEVEERYIAQFVRDQIPSECRRSEYWLGNVVKRPPQ